MLRCQDQHRVHVRGRHIHGGPTGPDTGLTQTTCARGSRMRTSINIEEIRLGVLRPIFPFGRLPGRSVAGSAFGRNPVKYPQDILIIAHSTSSYMYVERTVFVHAPLCRSSVTQCTDAVTDA